MDKVNIDGVLLTPLNIISHSKGDIFHVMKKGDVGFASFGEAYFSTINFNQIKGWNKHKKMILNLTVPLGEVLFVLYDDRDNSKTNGQFFKVKISLKNYCRITIPPGIWIAMAGVGNNINYVLNVASIKHDPKEKDTIELNKINYNWKIF